MISNGRGLGKTKQPELNMAGLGRGLEKSQPRYRNVQSGSNVVAKSSSAVSRSEGMNLHKIHNYSHSKVLMFCY